MSRRNVLAAVIASSTHDDADELAGFADWLRERGAGV
jgi:uncharacterized protein (TIGR02996 family)